MVSRALAHINMRRDIKHAINTSMNKTSCTSPDYRFMRLIHQGDNPNKEALIYKSYVQYHHDLSSYNLSCLHNNRIRKQYENPKISKSSDSIR